MPGETPKAFAAFCDYRDMGPRRSLSKLGRNLGKTKANFEPWSVLFRWVERCEAFDVDKAHEARTAAQEAQAAELREYRESAHAFASKLIKGQELMTAIAISRLAEVAPQKDKAPAEKITVNTACQFMRYAATIGAAAFDLKAEVVGVRQLERLAKGMGDASDEETDT